MREGLRPYCAIFLIPLLCVNLLAPSASAFTQSGASTFIGAGVPVGHEWLTRRAFFELPGQSDPHYPKQDSNDPRSSWTHGKAQNLDISGSGAQNELQRITSTANGETTYYSGYDLVYSVIIGNRWVDIGGFSVPHETTASVFGGTDCFSGVAQDPDELQHDHYLRASTDIGGGGAVTAAQTANQNFINYFIAAATAPSERMLVWDGGVTSSLVEVDRNYFLLGRAAHLLQDSFSPEHTVRIASDNYTQLRQVKSYVCTAGSEQHPHTKPTVFNYELGDVVWNDGTALGTSKSFIASNMKTPALVALEATKDLWAAWLRTMGTQSSGRYAAAKAEATTIATNWLHYDAPNMSNWYLSTPPDSTYVNEGTPATGQGSQQQCVTEAFGVSTLAARLDQVRNAQAFCLYNIIPQAGYSDRVDTQQKLPFNWIWKEVSGTPPAGWTPRGPSTSTFLTLLNNGPSPGPLMEPTSPAPYIQIGAGPALWLVQVPTGIDQSFFFRYRYKPTFFLRQITAPDPVYYGVIERSTNNYGFPATSFLILPQQGGYVVIRDSTNAISLCSKAPDNYVYLSGDCNGDPIPERSQWTVYKDPGVD